jgi:hypothetical protein
VLCSPVGLLPTAVLLESSIFWDIPPCRSTGTALSCGYRTVNTGSTQPREYN